MINLLKEGDFVGIISCSDGVEEKKSYKIIKLKKVLENMGLRIILSNSIFEKSLGETLEATKRAKSLNELFADKKIKAIFDISGGDLANEILDFIDYKNIIENEKLYFGISDLSVILNAIYAKSKIKTYHYAPKNLIGENSKKHIEWFKNSFFMGKEDLFNIKYDILKKGEAEGALVGGNIRCFFKLLGTDYLPELENKILLLESFSGKPKRFITILTQMKQAGFFKKIQALILGNFYEMESKNYKPSIEEIILEITKEYNFPIIKTDEIGHKDTCKAVIIGKKHIIKF